MANNVFFYYYAPTWDCPPDGPIKLGNVLTSIKKPEQPLYTAPLPTDSEVFSSEKTEVKYSKERLREGKFSILTKFLSILGVGVDVSAGWKNRYLPLASPRALADVTCALWHRLLTQRLTESSDDEIYTFQRVETKQFVPKDDYIQKCIEAAAVRRHLDRSRYRKPVYIVTGLKTVYGAKAKSHMSREKTGQAGVSVDGTVWSGGTAPVSVELGVEGKVETKSGINWGGSSNFVFAFRVRKVHVNRKTQEVDKQDDYTKGALLGDEIKKITEELPDLFISSQEDPKAEDEGYDQDELMEGDKVVACAFPMAGDSEDEE